MGGIPNDVHWYEWLGSAQDRPYSKAYHPFAWRGWLDFGTGALGDMACHTINVAAMALGLFDPETVEVVDTSGIVDRETYPTWSIIKTHFGAREGRGPLDLSGTTAATSCPRRRSPRSPPCSTARRWTSSGLLLVGEKGSFYSVNDYGAEHMLLPKEQFKDMPKVEAKPAPLPRPLQGVGRRHQGRRPDARPSPTSTTPAS